MFISIDQFDDAYKKIRADALDSDCTVWLLVAPDVDGLCAANIFTSLLKKDFVGYKMLPVANFGELAVVRDEIKRNPGQVRSIILINAGGTADILQEMDADDDQDMANITFYILDSHRPFNLANVYEEERVVIFKETESQDDIPNMEDVFSDGEEEDDDYEHSDKRRRPDPDEEDAKRRRRLRREERLAEYYRSTYHGMAAAHLAWLIVSSIQGYTASRRLNPLLWQAIVGTTDQFIHERIDSDTYMLRAEQLHRAVASINDTSTTEDGGDDGLAHDALQISSRREQQFVLLRNWSLFEAMRHSRYVAARLNVWKQSGTDRLKNLLAKMGFSLDICKQNWCSMERGMKEDLEERFDLFAKEFNLADCHFTSFVAKQGFHKIASASDVVYAVAAFLETAPIDASKPDDWQMAFFRALDALSFDKYDTLAFGTELAKQQIKAVMRQVESIVEGKNGIRRNRSFRWVVMKEGPDLRYFVHPLTLRKLGLYLLDTYRFSKEARKRTLPLVLASKNPETETYLVVGLWLNGVRTEGVVEKNDFGTLFEKAGTVANARIRLNSFDSSVMEIRCDDLLPFIRELQRSILKFGGDLAA